MTLLAVANGAGDVAVVVASAVGSHSATQIAVGELLGSGMFVSCFVLGVIAYNFPFEATREFLRDCMFLLVAVAWLGATVLDGAITTLESLSFVALYAVYLFVVVTGHFGGAGARGPRGGVAEGEAVVATAGAGRGDDEIGKGGDGKRWLPLQLMRGWQPPIAETNDGADGADGGAWDRWGGIVEYVNPVNDEIVKGGSLRDRVLIGLRAPAVVVLRLSVPVVDETRQHMAWNKTALMAQVCVCVCACVCSVHAIQKYIHTHRRTYIHPHPHTAYSGAVRTGLECPPAPHPARIPCQHLSGVRRLARAGGHGGRHCQCDFSPQPTARVCQRVWCVSAGVLRCAREGSPQSAAASSVY